MVIISIHCVSVMKFSHVAHLEIFQVLEMFSSEGDLHLELPGGEREAPRKLWVRFYSMKSFGLNKYSQQT